MPDTPESPRDRRKNWTVQRFGPDDAAAMADADARFWAEVPIEHRATLT